ncbi:MAG: hypothetical protein SFY66_01640 [Oculatellaceae cyanobacterium bins.114]|nr:hypothetical protein [Oculatellaceae cyanobacterium bins.114]
MEPLTSAAIAIATLIFTKASEKTGEHLGEAISTQVSKLIQLIRKKPLVKMGAIEQPEQTIDYGQAVLELEEAGKADPEIFQAIQAVATAVQANSKLAQQITDFAKGLEQSHPATVQNYGKLAEEIKNVFQGNTFTSPVTFN